MKMFTISTRVQFRGLSSRSDFEVHLFDSKCKLFLVFIYIINSPMVKETTRYVLVLGPYNLTLDYKQIY